MSHRDDSKWTCLLNGNNPVMIRHHDYKSSCLAVSGHLPVDSPTVHNDEYLFIVALGSNRVNWKIQFGDFGPKL